MPYVPSNWIKDKTNEQVVHNILNKYLNSDINIDIDSAIKELKDIGETTVIDKIRNGTIVVD